MHASSGFLTGQAIAAALAAFAVGAAAFGEWRRRQRRPAPIRLRDRRRR